MKHTDKWIQKAIKPQNKGKLHQELGVKKGKDIPQAKLEKAAKSKNPTLRREAQLAETLRKLPRKHGSKTKAKKSSVW